MFQVYPVPFRRPAISGNPNRVPLIYPWLFIFLVVLLGINLPTPIHAQNNHKNNILVLNSYNYGYGWSDSIMKGIEAALPKQQYNLTVEYMDTKGYEQPVYFQKLYDFYHYKFASKKFDVIICSDDNAFNFLKKYKNDLFAPQTPVVFCGVNFFQDADLNGRQDFTGVVENFDVAGTIEIIRKLQSNLKEILVISDRTTTGISNTLKAREALAEQFPQQKYTVMDDVTMDDLLQTLGRAPVGTVVLYLGFAIDKTGKSYAPLEDSLALISRRSKLPFYSVWEFTLESVVGGMITSGFYQGEMAAKMAQRLLNGEKVATIPVAKESPNKPMFNYNQMKRFGISPSQLPPGSIIVNQPVSFYEEHKLMVLGTTAVLGGLFLVIIVLTITINKRKRAEEALAKNYSELQNTAQQLEQSRNMLQMIIESIPIRVFWKDNDLRYMGCNALFARDAGFSRPEQLLGKDDFAMGWKEQADLYRTDDRQVMESRRPKLNIVEPQTTPTGDQIWLNTNKVPLQMPNGEVFGVLGLYEDITSRKQAEEALRSTRDYLENIFANSADSIGIVDRQGKFTHWNKAAEELYGYTFEELEGTSAIDLYADPGEFYEMLRQLHQCGFIRNYEINMKKKDGSVFPASLSIKILCNSDNKVIGSITVCRDLTETKRMMLHLQNEIHQHEQARQALLESEKKLINIIDFLPDATFVIDTKGKVIAWNKAIEEMTGVKAQDMVGKDNYEYALPFYGERRPILIDLVLEPDKGIEKYVEIKKEDKVLVAVGHFNNFRGKETYLFGKASPLIDLHGDIIGSIESIRDITALRQAEIDRLQFSKLESIGTLAGGIAHDFNNILTAILGNIGLAMLNRKLGDEEIKRLVQAERGCLRAKELSGQLLTFAKGGTPIKKVTSLAKLVRESAKLALAGSKSRCEFSISEDLWSVEADEGQINQVINNLLINADQAMPRGGIIKVEAENIVVKEGSNLPLSEGKYVKLTLIDQGIGIPSQYLDKVFDPYFTTKQKGSGLGLATTYSIIIKHSGYLKLESQVGAGTTFHIYLPAQEGKAVAALEEQVTPSLGQGKVLVMDDDEKIREIICRMLGRLGYEADSAIDGSQAIEKFVKAQESGRQFDAVIIDLTVPGGMGGKETIENLLKINPQVKAIVSSGYSDDPIMANFKEYGFSEVIAKPYRVVELSKILERVILKQGD